MRLKILCLTILVSTTIHLFAQLSLDEYRQQVIDYSLTLKGARNTLQQSEESVVYTKGLLLPELLATGSYRHYIRQTDGQKPWSVAFEPQIIQTIYGGGVIRAEVEKAELTSRVALCSEIFTLTEVSYAAGYAYWNYWAMNRYYLVMLQYVEIITDQMEKIEHRYNEGYTSKGDLLMIKSQLSDAKYNLISASKSRSEALYNLNILRGVAPSDSVILTKFLLSNHRMPNRLPFEAVIDQRADYSAMLLKEQIANVETKGVRGRYNPTLQGGVVGGVRSYIPNLNGDTYWDGSAYVSLSIPIYRFGERRKAVAISRSSEHQAELNSAALFDDIVKEESNGWLAVVESRAQVDLAEESLEIASENLEIATYSYDEGLVSILDLMQSQISWMQIYTNAINSQYNYLVALVYYQKITGAMY